MLFVDNKEDSKKKSTAECEDGEAIVVSVVVIKNERKKERKMQRERERDSEKNPFDSSSTKKLDANQRKDRREDENK